LNPVCSDHVYLGIGSNIEPKQHIEKALSLLETSLGNISVSPIYQNPAEGFEGNDFLNLVVGFEYSGDLSGLLELLGEIEQKCGRQRQMETGKGSRTIDLDLLMFGNLEGEYNGVELPRSDIFNRQFVWRPLLNLFEEKARLNVFEAAIRSKIESGIKTLEPASTMFAV